PPLLYPPSLHDALPIYARPTEHPLGSVDRAGPAAAVPCNVPPWTALVPVVGLRQRHDERPRRSRQRRRIPGVGHALSSDDRGSRSEEHTSELQSQSNLV